MLQNARYKCLDDDDEDNDVDVEQFTGAGRSLYARLRVQINIMYYYNNYYTSSL